MKSIKNIAISIGSFIIFTFSLALNGQTQKDTLKISPTSNDSYDNFKNKPNYSPSYVVIKSKVTGNILFEESINNGSCQSCYDKLTVKADSCFKIKNYTDAATLFFSAFKLNDNKGKVKHRISAACCYVKLNDYDNAFENLDRVVFIGKLHNAYELTSNDCLKPLQKDTRWQKLLDGIEKNLAEIQRKLKAETPVEQ